MNLRIRCFAFLLISLAGKVVFAQQADPTGPAPIDKPYAIRHDNVVPDTADAMPRNGQLAPKASVEVQPKQRVLNVFGSWRFRAEAWDWFQPTAGENAYAFTHSLLRAGISQTRERFEWLVEGAQDAILGLPGDAIAPGNQGQLGLGGTYFVANQNRRNIASGFLKQGYLGFGLPLDGKLTLGRFGFSDGTEVRLADATLAELVNTRVAQRLIGESRHNQDGSSPIGPIPRLFRWLHDNVLRKLWGAC